MVFTRDDGVNNCLTNEFNSIVNRFLQHKDE